VPPHCCKPNTAVALCPHIAASPIQRLPCAPTFLQTQYSGCPVPPHFWDLRRTFLAALWTPNNKTLASHLDSTSLCQICRRYAAYLWLEKNESRTFTNRYKSSPHSLVFKLTGELESSVNFLDLKMARDSNQINIGTFTLPVTTCSTVRHANTQPAVHVPCLNEQTPCVTSNTGSQKWRITHHKTSSHQ